MPPRVILIGPPGAGKSVIGKNLAQRMESQFSDTDALIEESAGKSVAQIFIDDGESVFRDLEARIVATALTEREGVLSLGGGAILRDETRRAISESGAEVIFLDVTLAIAAPRIGFNRDRPLLLNNPRQQWQKLMDERRSVYEGAASMHIQVGDRSVAAVATEIFTELEKEKA
jgi:shikimate kinase